MALLVLDFDGVICDSARECFETALRFFGETHDVSSAHLDGGVEAWYRAFMTLRLYTSKGSDYVACLYLIQQQAWRPVSSRSVFLSACEDLLPQLAADYGVDSWDALDPVFQARRRHYINADEARWLNFNPLYPAVKSALLGLQDQIDALYLATSKPTMLALKILQHNQIHVPEKRIIGGDKTPDASNKNPHLGRIAAMADLPLEHLHFFDDQISHVLDAANFGVHSYLAGWGYNGPAEHQLAHNQSLPVAVLDDIDETFHRILAS